VAAHLLRGNALAGLRSFDEALKSIEGAIALDPEGSPSYTQLGLVQLARGRRDDAEAAFTRAVEIAPRSPDAHLALGAFYWSSGRAADTQRAFVAALQIDPSNEVANRAMAAFAIASGKPGDAEPYLRRIAEERAGDPLPALALADYYLLVNRPVDALRTLGPLTAPGLRVPGARQRLARARALSGDREGAARDVEVALRENAGDVDAQLLKADLLRARGQADEAFALVKAAAASHPSVPEAHFALGRFYASRGDLPAAESAFLQVLRLNPNAAAARVELTRLQILGGKPADAVRTADDAARVDPRSLAARLAVVRSALAAQDLPRAERALTELEASRADSPAINALWGTLALGRKDYPRARAAFERAQTLDPASTEALAGRLAVDVATGDAASARVRIEKHLTESQSPDLLLAARTYWILKDAASAERVLRQAIQEDPARLTPYNMLGQIYLGQQKLDEARAEFEALAGRQMNPAGALTMAGVILQAQGNLTLARERFEQAIAADPRAVVAANNLAWIYAERGDNLDKALELAQTALAGAPDAPEVLDTLGWVYYKKDLAKLAVPLLERCVAQAPNNPSYHYHLGLSYLKAGESATGRRALQRALDVGASGADAQAIRQILSGAS
jgi:tetratricopeptide (TPR) repeat protein